jgi:hypothetical protein
LHCSSRGMVPPNVEVLDRFTEATAGKTYVVEKAADLPRVLSSIERDIRTQYLVSYVSNVSRGSAFHPVDVATKRGRVQTVAGFYY